MTTAENPYPVPVSEMRERYLKLYSGAVNDVMRFDYKVNAALPASYAPLRENMKLCGQAFTVKGAPDITSDGESVMWAPGDTVTAQWGEVMTMAAMRAGCRGAFINGIRDTEAILELGFPVFHQYRTNVGMLGRFRMFHYQKPIRIGEVVINPGDWIFGDIDGVIRIPAADAYTVLLRAEGILKKEVGIRDMVNSGMKPTKVVEQGGYF